LSQSLELRDLDKRINEQFIACRLLIHFTTFEHKSQSKFITRRTMAPTQAFAGSLGSKTKAELSEVSLEFSHCVVVVPLLTDISLGHIRSSRLWTKTLKA